MLPLKDRVVCRQFKPIEKTKSGILLPEAAKEKPNLGVVLQVGPEVKVVKPGMVIILGKRWFTEFKLGSEELMIVNEPDIVGICDGVDLSVLGQEYEEAVIAH